MHTIHTHYYIFLKKFGTWYSTVSTEILQVALISMALLASGSSSVKIWSFDGSSLEPSASAVGTAEDILSVRWNHTNQVVAAGTSASNIHLLQGSTGQLLSTLSFLSSGIEGAVRCLSFSSNSRYLAAAVSRSVHVWDLKKRSVKISLEQQATTVDCVSFTADGLVVSGDDHGSLKIWDINRNEITGDLKRNGNAAAIRSLEVSPVMQAACGYSDGGLAVWDLVSSSAACLLAHLHRGPVQALAVSPRNPRLVVSAGEDGRINLIDSLAVPNTAPSAYIDSGERIMSISFQENAIHTAVGTHGGNVLVYDWRNITKPIVRVPAHNPFPVYSLSFQVNNVVFAINTQ